MKAFATKFFLYSSVAAFALGCGEEVGDTPKEGSEPGQCEDGADNDGDGDFDCDDADCAGAPVCGGNGDTGDNGVDADGDGYTVGQGDCDDEDDRINPGAEEKCNDRDDNCDDLVDNDPVDGSTYYEDWDNDGYGDENVAVDACEQPEGYVDNDEDCDDTSSQVAPGANEVSWNGVDEDCDGSDFNGQACMEQSLNDAMAWLSYYQYDVIDIYESIAGVFNYSVTNQTLYFNGQNGTVQSSEGSTTQFDLALDTEVAMNSSSDPFNFEMDAYIYNPVCLGHVNWKDLDFEGSVALTVQGSSVTGNVELSPAWSGVIQNDLNFSGCSISLINLAIGYAYNEQWIPFKDILFFMDDLYTEYFNSFAALLSAEVEWWLELNCSE